jgi:DNA primase catalytic core
MARIADEEIKRLKEEISIVALVEGRGIELKPHGRDLVGRCPFHNDKTPSLVISKGKNLWHCMGACQTGGSVIDWVMKSEKVKFRHAVEVLQSDFVQAGGAPHAALAKARKYEPVVEREADDQKMLNDVTAYYHETLKKSPEALRYLESRGLTNPEMVETFRLGFSNRTLGYRLPMRKRRDGAEIRNRLHNLGIMRESGHEHFAGSLVVPIFDEKSDVVEMYGRKITPRIEPAHTYLPGPLRGVFNLAAFQTSKEIIVCEALIDALTLWCAGLTNVTAVYGVNGFTKDHWEAFIKYGTERVLIAYDRDDAGETAAATLANELQAKGIGAYRIQFPKNMDANEYACKVKPAAKSLGVLVRSAIYLGGLPVAEAQVISMEPAPTVSVAASIPATQYIPSFAAVPLPPPPLKPPVEPAVSPEPPAPRFDIPAEMTSDDEAVIRLGDRRWRVRGIAKNLTHDQLRVNVLVSRGDGFHVDTLDMYTARARHAFAKEAAGEIGMTEEQVRTDLGRVFLKMEELHDERLRHVEPKASAGGKPLTPDEKTEALTFLQDPDLLSQVLADFAVCGVVGEEVNKLVGYLTSTSRKLDNPLAVIIQSSSAAGKSSLMEAVLAMMPAEEMVKYSAMSGQSLFYIGETSLKHKILAIVEEAGAQRASYSLKLLQSEGELTMASTGKDPETGKLITHEYRVEGPVMLMLTTTAMEIDEELLNRAIVLTVDEDRDQTRRIHAAQRRSQTLEGLLAKTDRNAIIRKHQNAQRLLRPLQVVNPHAEELTFLDDRTRTRRDHVKYLTLIRAVALLHQYQRQIKTVEHRGAQIEYIEVTRADIAVANRLAHATLGRSLDELAPQTRRLLFTLDAMVATACAKLEIERKEYRFTRRQLREHIGWSDFQVRMHLDKLVQLEYALVHRGGRGQQFVYELLYDGQGKDGKPFLVGLQDVSQYDFHFEHEKPNLEHSKPDDEHASSPERAPIVPPVSTPQKHRKPLSRTALKGADSKTPRKAHTRGARK